MKVFATSVLDVHSNHSKGCVQKYGFKIVNNKLIPISLVVPVQDI